MKIIHSTEKEIVKPIPYHVFFSTAERDNWRKEYVKENRTFALQNAINIFDYELDFIPMNNNAECNQISLYLFGTKGECFIRTYYISRKYDTYSFTHIPEHTDMFDSETVLIESFGFSSAEGDIEIGFTFKEISEEDKPVFFQI